MLVNLKATIISTIVAAVVLTTALEYFVVDRVFIARDLQANNLQAYRTARAIDELLSEARATTVAGQLPGKNWADRLERLSTPEDCCAAEKSELVALVSGGNVSISAVRGAMNALRSTIDQRLIENDNQVNEVLQQNQILPWLSLLVVILVIFASWIFLRLGVQQPVAQLLDAVLRTQSGQSFSFKHAALVPVEVTQIATAFENVLNRLKQEVSGREQELRTTRDLARREAEQMSAELAELIDGNSAPMFSLDTSGRIKTWNRKMAALTRIPLQVAIGVPFDMRFIDGSYRLSFHNAFQAALEGSPSEGLRIPLLSEDGRPIDLLLNLTPQKDLQRGGVVGVTGVGHPVGEFLEKTVKAVERQRTVHFNELASGAAHQLNQPLQTMRLYLANALNRLRSEDLDRDALSQKLRGIDQQLARISDIVEHLREFGRPNPPVPGGFDLMMVTERCVDLNKGTMIERGIRLTLESELHNERATGHPLQIEKALIALLDNAREAITDHRPEQPLITIRLSKPDDGTISLVVEDNGGGVDETVINRVFDPFFTTRVNTRNVGLGLSSARALIEDMGGQVELESQGETTTVTILIPAMGIDDTEVEV